MKILSDIEDLAGKEIVYVKGSYRGYFLIGTKDGFLLYYRQEEDPADSGRYGCAWAYSEILESFSEGGNQCNEDLSLLLKLNLLNEQDVQEIEKDKEAKEEEERLEEYRHYLELKEKYERI